MTIAAFGCTTNRTPGAGHPVTATPTTGPMAPASSATPGSESAPVTTPTTMVSASPTAPSTTDPIAILAADRAYQGVILGPAAPGTGLETSSMQQVSGQFVSPSMAANPQTTINASISSAPTPAISSGAGEGAGGVVALPSGTGVVTGAVTSTGAVTAGITNSGVSGATNTTATGIAGSTTPSVTPSVTRVGSGLVSAPAPLGSVVATPTLGTSPRLNVDNTAALGGSTLGVTTGDASMITGASGSNQAANGRVVTGRSTATITNVAPVTTGATTLGVTNSGTVGGSTRAVVQGINSTGTATTGTAPAATGPNLRVGARSGAAPASSTVSGNIRVETASDGTVTMTNTTTPQRRPSIFRRALRAIGIGSGSTTTTTGTTSTTTTTNP